MVPSEVSEALTHTLQELCVARPRDPIQYLANRLHIYASTMTTETKQIASTSAVAEVSYGTSRPNRAWVCKPAPDFKDLDVIIIIRIIIMRVISYGDRLYDSLFICIVSQCRCINGQVIIITISWQMVVVILLPTW